MAPCRWGLVRTFQLPLAKLGYDLQGTGVFGGATDTVVTHFQAIDAALARAGHVCVPPVNGISGLFRGDFGES